MFEKYRWFVFKSTQINFLSDISRFNMDVKYSENRVVYIVT